MPITRRVPSRVENIPIYSKHLHPQLLNMLYERKAAVEELIRSLEEYERNYGRRKAECVEFTRSGSAR